MGMIAFLRGTVAESYPQRLILDVHGVGYEVIVPLSTFDRLNPLPGRELTLKTYLHVRENMQVLYGFATDAERDIFLLLIDRVSGIGPATAIAILGSLPAGMLPHGSQMLAEPVPGWGSRSVHGAQGGADQFVRIRVRMVFQVGGDRLAGLHLLEPRRRAPPPRQRGMRSWR